MLTWTWCGSRRRHHSQPDKKAWRATCHPALPRCTAMATGLCHVGAAPPAAPEAAPEVSAAVICSPNSHLIISDMHHFSAHRCAVVAKLVPGAPYPPALQRPAALPMFASRGSCTAQVISRDPWFGPKNFGINWGERVHTSWVTIKQAAGSTPVPATRRPTSPTRQATQPAVPQLPRIAHSCTVMPRALAPPLIPSCRCNHAPLTGAGDYLM